MPFEQWLSFCLLALIATITPGPAALLVSVNSLTYGFKLSLATVFGNVTGLLCLSSLSVLGLIALIIQSAVAFTVVKTLGALYLCYLGIKLFRSGSFKLEVTKKALRQEHVVKLFGQGIAVSMTNPKALVFTIALFPQFITLHAPVLPQFVVLVTSFMGLSFACLSGYAFIAARAKPRVVQSKLAKRTKQLCGATFIGFGGLLLFTRNQ